MGAPETPARRLEVARTLAMDGLAAELAAAFRAADVRPILLKGPALARLLYGDELRSYADVDLLVSSRDLETAEAVLDGLGFERGPIVVEPDLGLPHAYPWRRADGSFVDLHQTLAGAGVAPPEAWAALEGRTKVERVASTEIELLDDPARALVVALHASQHGADAPKPIEDLRRALELLPEDVWREAAGLAGELDAEIAFSSGLRLLADGDALAERLSLPDADLVDASRKAGSSTRLALGFNRLASTPGVRRKLLLILAELAPSPEHMRWWSPLARRGRVGLTAAYLQRALQFLWDTPPSVLAWRRVARRRHAPPVADGWYRLLEGAQSPEDALLETPVVRRLPSAVLDRLMGRAFTRGLLLFAISIDRPAIGVQREEPGWGTLLVLRALLGRRRKLVSLQHIVHPRRHPLRRWLHAWDRWATRRALLRGHALSRADLEMLPKHYRLPPVRFAYVPWPLAKRPPAQLPPLPEEPLVLGAGRAYCDWETLFAAAKGAGWPLTVVCGRHDLRRVRRLNRGVGAKVL
ncbi:MAG: nucleotidyltransferase family protein, partial [Thermoleophilaceae bacterium]